MNKLDQEIAAGLKELTTGIRDTIDQLNMFDKKALIRIYDTKLSDNFGSDISDGDKIILIELLSSINHLDLTYCVKYEIIEAKDTLNEYGYLVKIAKVKNTVIPKSVLFSDEIITDSLIIFNGNHFLDLKAGDIVYKTNSLTTEEEIVLIVRNNKIINPLDINSIVIDKCPFCEKRLVTEGTYQKKCVNKYCISIACNILNKLQLNHIKNNQLFNTKELVSFKELWEIPEVKKKMQTILIDCKELSGVEFLRKYKIIFNNTYYYYQYLGKHYDQNTNKKIDLLEISNHVADSDRVLKVILNELITQ